MGRSFNDLRRRERNTPSAFEAKRAELELRQGARLSRSQAFASLGFDADDSAVLAAMPRRREGNRPGW